MVSHAVTPEKTHAMELATLSMDRADSLAVGLVSEMRRTVSMTPVNFHLPGSFVAMRFAMKTSTERGELTMSGPESRTQAGCSALSMALPMACERILMYREPRRLRSDSKAVTTLVGMGAS